jgi:hypothetical protein
MALIRNVLSLRDRYCAATGAASTTLGSRIFRDGKAFARLDAGGDCTTRKAEFAVAWFAEHWPPGCEWPSEIERPTG